MHTGAGKIYILSLHDEFATSCRARPAALVLCAVFAPKLAGLVGTFQEPRDYVTDVDGAIRGSILVDRMDDLNYQWRGQPRG